MEVRFVYPPLPFLTFVMKRLLRPTLVNRCQVPIKESNEVGGAKNRCRNRVER